MGTVTTMRMQLDPKGPNQRSLLASLKVRKALANPDYTNRHIAPLSMAYMQWLR